MKERFLKIVKIFLMILGGLFLIQILLVLGAIIGLSSFANYNYDFNFEKQSSGLKEMQPIIDYAQSYKAQNGKYPKEVENMKIKKGLEYKYETSNDGNCFTVTIKSNKNNLVKKYQKCSVENESSSSNSQNYVEYSD